VPEMVRLGAGPGRAGGGRLPLRLDMSKRSGPDHCNRAKRPLPYKWHSVTMATVPSNPDSESSLASPEKPAWPRGSNSVLSVSGVNAEVLDPVDGEKVAPSQRDALQVLLAFSALHEQVRRRKALAAKRKGFEVVAAPEFEPEEQFVLDDVLQLVAERAVAITGADGLAIALAENNAIVLRAAAGTVRPDIGARIDRDSAFTGASFRNAQTVICDDTETDSRVNLQACRRLGARSMVAVPLCGRRRVIGLLEAFSTWPFAFNDSDVQNLSLLAELVVGALKPEDEDRFAESAQIAATQLESAPAAASVPTAVTAVITPAAPVVSAPSAQTAIPAPIAKESLPAPVTQAPPTPAQVAPAIPVPTAPVKTTVEPATKETAQPAETPAGSTARPKKEFTFDKIPEFEGVVAEPAPQLKFGQAEPEKAHNRAWVPVALIFAVIALAFTIGIWVKWRGQAGAETVATPKSSSAAVENPSGTTATPTPTSSGAPAANANNDLSSETEEAAITPASPAELSKFPKITGIRHWSSADSTTIVLDLEDQVQYEAHRLTGPDRIYFDLHDTQLTPELSGKSIEVGDALLNRIRVAQPVSGMTRIVLETKSNPNFSVSLEPNPYRLVVEVRKIGAAPKGAVNLFPNLDEEKARLSIVVPPPTKEDLQWRAHVPKLRIVVDAGHGGWDLGTVGKRGLLEKDLVLEISERLGKLLESRLGMEVVYTRLDDNYIPLDERAEIANQAQADLFISVHANYSDLASARGVETYYTSTFSAPGPKDADGGAPTNPKSPMPKLSAADLHERNEQSRQLAASVQRSLYGTLSQENPGLRDRGIKEAGFVVLTESAMPGILAEVSFVSSPADEQKLRSDGYREQIAEALYRGIARYAVNSHSVKVAAK